MPGFHGRDFGISYDGDALCLRGELDTAAADELASMRNALPRAGVVELDLADVTFIGSAGVHFLLQLRSSVLDRGGRLEVSDASATVRAVLEMCGLLDEFGLDANVPRTDAH